jgi:hypothetical protein
MDRAALHFLFSNLLKGFAGLGIILGMYLIGRRYFGPDDFAWLVGLADMPLVFYGIFFVGNGNWHHSTGSIHATGGQRLLACLF